MSPTINQEVVATLLEVLLTHEEVNAAIKHALVRRDQPTQSDVTSQDLQASINSAALLEARLMAVEWTQISLLALAGSQVCACVGSTMFTFATVRLVSFLVYGPVNNRAAHRVPVCKSCLPSPTIRVGVNSRSVQQCLPGTTYSRPRRLPEQVM